MNVYEQLKRHQKVPVRLVGLDLDGTVFTEDKVITPRTIHAISRAIESGITVLPATGRPEIGIPENHPAHGNRCQQIEVGDNRNLLQHRL